MPVAANVGYRASKWADEGRLRVMEVNSAERERASAMGESFRFANRKDAPQAYLPGASPEPPFAFRPVSTQHSPSRKEVGTSGLWLNFAFPKGMPDRNPVLGRRRLKDGNGSFGLNHLFKP